MKIVLISIFTIFGASFAASAQGTAKAQNISPQINVQPEFRATPIWYWQSPEKKCVPVPSYDVVSRIAPERVRQENIQGQSKSCEIRLEPRQVEAVLECNGQLLSKFYLKKELCQTHLKTVAASKRP